MPDNDIAATFDQLYPEQPTGNAANATGPAPESPQGSPATPPTGNEPAPAATPTSQPTPGIPEEPTPQQLKQQLLAERPELAPYIENIDKTWQRGYNSKMEELAAQRKQLEAIPQDHIQAYGWLSQALQNDPQAAATYLEQVLTQIRPQDVDPNTDPYQPANQQPTLSPQMQQEWDMMRRASFDYQRSQVEQQVTQEFAKLAQAEGVQIPDAERDAVLTFAAQKNLGIEDLADVWRAKYGYQRIRQQGIAEGQTLRQVKEGNAPASSLAVGPADSPSQPSSIADFVNLAFK